MQIGPIHVVREEWEQLHTDVLIDSSWPQEVVSYEFWFLRLLIWNRLVVVSDLPVDLSWLLELLLQLPSLSTDIFVLIQLSKHQLVMSGGGHSMSIDTQLVDKLSSTKTVSCKDSPHLHQLKLSFFEACASLRAVIQEHHVLATLCVKGSDRRCDRKVVLGDIEAWAVAASVWLIWREVSLLLSFDHNVAICVCVEVPVAEVRVLNLKNHLISNTRRQGAGVNLYFEGSIQPIFMEVDVEPGSGCTLWLICNQALCLLDQQISGLLTPEATEICCVADIIL